MTINTKRWVVQPDGKRDPRCWQVCRILANGKVSKPVCYHIHLADALAWCAEYEVRNDLDQAAELAAVADSVRAEHSRLMAEINKSLNEHGIS